MAARRAFVRRSLICSGVSVVMTQCCTPRATISRDGGSVQLWYGGGEESSHSRPCELSQTWPVALAPPFTHFQMMNGNSSCDRPKPNAPMDDTRFQSANCTA